MRAVVWPMAVTSGDTRVCHVLRRKRATDRACDSELFAANAVASSAIGARHVTCVGVPMVKSRSRLEHDMADQALYPPNSSAGATAVELAHDSIVTAQELAVKLLTEAALKCLSADSVRDHRPGAGIP
jgi:hypothetical protein